MEETIADTERLAIFVYDSGKMKRDGAHWRAFMPGNKDGERSFFRVDGMGESEIADLGRTHAENRGNQRLHGWGELKAHHVRNSPPLTLKSAEPPPRHGVIVDWPAEPQDKQKLALALAGLATTVRC